MGFCGTRYVIFFSIAAQLLVSDPAVAIDFDLLTKGRRATYEYNPLTGEGSMLVRTGPDRHLRSLGDPTICPSSSSIELRIAGSATTQQETVTELVDLPCDNWSKRGSGYRYKDRSGIAGGITTIRYRRGGLTVRAESPGYTPIPGPYAFTQVKFNVEAINYLIRLNGFRKNTDALVQTFLQSPAGHRTEAAFWDTLWGIEDRGRETIALAAKAVARKPGDARAYFLGGMIQAHLSSYAVDSWLDAGPEEVALLEGMVENMDIAMRLLWDGTTGDSRGLGFLSGGRFELGVLLGDPDIIAQGELEIAQAAADNPVFSTFTPLGAIGPVHKGNSPEYQAIVDLLDGYFPVALSQCGDQQELCFDGGLAPQNLPGSVTFFADVYAKGNRVDTAREFLNTAISLGTAQNWRPEFIEGAKQRLADLDARVALFQDDDLSNDPPMVGSGGVKTCAWCHYR